MFSVPELLIGPARAVLNGAADVDAILTHASKSTATGNVRIGAPPAFIRRSLVPLLPAFTERHPDIVLDLRASDALVDLAEVGLDLAIRSGPLDGFPGMFDCRGSNSTGSRTGRLAT